MRPGETKTTTVHISSSTPGNYAMRANAPGLTISPTTFNVDLTTQTSADQVIQITAPLGTAGNYTLSIGDQLTVYETVQITVSDGQPDFTLSATPLEVSVPNNVQSQDVLFTVASVNGYTGPVKITWVVDGGASPTPNDNNFTGNVSPTTPFKFTRKMYRYTTDTADIPITFNATDVPFTKQRSVTINVKHQ